MSTHDAQLCNSFARRLETDGKVTGRYPGKPGIEAVRNGGNLGWSWQGFGTYCDEQRSQGLSLEGPVARHAFVRDDSEGPDVRSVIDICVAFGLLRTHIVRRAEHCARMRLDAATRRA